MGNKAAKPLPPVPCGPLPSLLDPFREKLLQMDKDKIKRTKMLAWLRSRGMPCSRSNLRYFLATRRDGYAKGAEVQSQGIFATTKFCESP